jgi:hypothetical protein
MLVEELTLNDSTFIPPAVTAVAPVKDVPVISTGIPCGPLLGVKELIVGNAIYPGKLLVPPAVVTETIPEPPEGVIATIVVAEITVNVLAEIPPKLTAVAPRKLFPVMVTLVPAIETAGIIEFTTGGGIKTNPAKESFPVDVATNTYPEAPLPTEALIAWEDNTVIFVAGTDPNLTTLAPDKLSPLIVITVPSPAACGAIEYTLTLG